MAHVGHTGYQEMASARWLHVVMLPMVKPPSYMGGNANFWPSGSASKQHTCIQLIAQFEASSARAGNGAWMAQHAL